MIAYQFTISLSSLKKCDYLYFAISLEHALVHWFMSNHPNCAAIEVLLQINKLLKPLIYLDRMNEKPIMESSTKIYSWFLAINRQLNIL